MFDCRVVIHYLDGRTLAGYGERFMPWETEILVKDRQETMFSVQLSQVKVVCFVKDFDSDYKKTHMPPDKLIYVAVHGRKVEISFKDGEKLVGMASLEEPPQGSFFVTPLNPNSNNIMVFVNHLAIRRFCFSNDPSPGGQPTGRGRFGT